MRRLTLLVNADNTLWESNVFFENTLERFFSLVEPFGYARAYARHILNETERQNIQQHGYGVRSTELRVRPGASSVLILGHTTRRTCCRHTLSFP